MKQLQFEWRNRVDALEPVALVALDVAAIGLAKKLLSFDDEKLASFRGVCAANLLLIAGETENLPWVNDLIYLGKDPLAPLLLLPTNKRPSVPVDVFERILINRFSDKLPFAAIENRIVPTGEMRLVSRKVLENWMRVKI